MNAILDVAQLQRTSMTPRVNDEQRRGPSSNDRTLDALAALAPAEDPELPDVLALQPADIERLQALAGRVADARAALTSAEASLAVADRSSRRLESLERQAGASAAQAFRGGKDDQQATKALAAEIADCRLARSAMPALKDDVDQARENFHHARGDLHGAATSAIRQMMLRASRRYAQLALEVTRCVAAVEAGITSLPGVTQSDLMCGWSMAMSDLSLPAFPEPLRTSREGVTAMYWRDSLLRAQHDRLTAHTTAAHGHLQAALRDAIAPSGIAVRSLLG